MKAVILCAGKGERMRPLTESIPKPMIPINGKPLLEYLIQLCGKHSISDIYINTSYLPEKIKEYFGDGSNFGVRINYSFEEKLLGTAGALNNFRENLKERFFVIHSDNITDIDLSEMASRHISSEATGSIFLFNETQADDKTTPGCVILNTDGTIKDIIERPNTDERAKIAQLPLELKKTNGGIYLLEPEVLKYIPEGVADFPKDVFPNLLRNHRMLGYTSQNCYFKEVGQMMRYLAAKREIESGKVRLNLESRIN